MGQYWYVVNLDKREFVNPHKVGSGLKLWEQMANHPGTGTALVVLLAAMPEKRGGGDLEPDDVVGRWAGDRIALVGDYAESEDLKPKDKAHLIYWACSEDQKDWEARLANIADKRRAAAVRKLGRFTDISDLVAKTIERELAGKFVGEGWREWTTNTRRAS